ncbi:MAG: hypothetical protein GX174_08155 [Lentisphaerae bacterium]|jgi:hypothetical protein|nr:hypothetical protein [Lentisphaerota bacterium]
MKTKAKAKKSPKAQDAALRHDPRMRVSTADADGLVWYSPWNKPFRLEGMGWNIPGTFRRMPLEHGGELTPAVDDLAWHTAGVQLRFRTNSHRISLRVKLRGVHAMDHMPATGEAGFDAYIGDVGDMIYAGTARFDRSRDAYQSTLCTLPTAERRTVTINFPLYKGVAELEVGLDDGSRVFAPPAHACKKAVVVYGTSITQGGCASRPGMAYTNILSRRIDAPFINLGFSGSGKGEPGVARVIATLPAPALFVMDYEANAGSLEKVRETLVPFIEIVRARWPRTGIMVVSRVIFASEAYNEGERKRRLETRDYQRNTVNRLRRAGDTLIAFVDGGTLLGKDYGNCSVDGVHQTDLGFLRMADRLERPFINLINLSGA